MPHPSPFPVSRRRRMSSPQPSEAPLPMSLLPSDLQVEILSRVGDAVSLVRCAATGKAWRRLITDPGFLSYLHRRRRAGAFDPSTLLGFFFRDTSQSLPRRRLYRRRPTRFLLLGNSLPEPPSAPVVLPFSRFLTTADDLRGFAPVASSGAGGLLALCRFKFASSPIGGICVCNPLAGTSTLLPPLPSIFVPEKIVFLEADTTSFRLLAVMDDRQGTLVLRVFSSESGDWDTPHIVELPDNMVLEIASPAVVHCSAVHWICGTPALPHAVHVLAVGLTETGTSVSRFDLPPRASVHHLTTASRAMRLFSSALGTLSFVLVDDGLVLSIWNLEDSSTDRKRWSCCKAVYVMPMLSPIILSDSKVELSIQGLCEKSGSLFLHVVGEGLFMLNLGTMKLVKVCKGHYITKYLCPYVTDFASCIKAMKSP